MALLCACTQREQPNRPTQPAAPAVSSTPAPTTLEVVGGDFPDLIADERKTEPAGDSQTAADPCAGLRATRISELKGAWPAAIEQIAFECGREQDEDTPNTTATATLRANTVTMHGLPVIEVRVSESGYGDARQYTLAGSFPTQGKMLLENITKTCRARAALPCTDAAVESDTSYYLQTSEIGGIRIEQDEKNSQQIVYAEVSGE